MGHSLWRLVQDEERSHKLPIEQGYWSSQVFSAITAAANAKKMTAVSSNWAVSDELLLL